MDKDLIPTPPTELMKFALALALNAVGWLLYLVIHLS